MLFARHGCAGLVRAMAPAGHEPKCQLGTGACSAAQSSSQQSRAQSKCCDSAFLGFQLQNQTQTHLPSGKQVQMRVSKGSHIFCLIRKSHHYHVLLTNLTLHCFFQTYLWLCYSGKINLDTSCLSALFGLFPKQRYTSWTNFRLRSKAGRVF